METLQIIKLVLSVFVLVAFGYWIFLRARIHSLKKEYIDLSNSEPNFTSRKYIAGTDPYDDSDKPISQGVIIIEFPDGSDFMRGDRLYGPCGHMYSVVKVYKHGFLNKLFKYFGIKLNNNNCIKVKRLNR